MCNDHVDYFASLLNDQPVASEGTPVAQEPSKPLSIGRPEGAHACVQCGGTGKYSGRRVHQDKSHCFACKGKGWFKTSVAQRQKARSSAAASKARRYEETKAAFREANPGLIERLIELSSWHGYARSLLDGYVKWGSLTDKQVAAGWASIAKVDAAKAARDAEKAARSGDVGVEAIETLFKTAIENGLKKPRFITKRLVIERAPAHGRNAGALYVRCDGEYAGKIVGGQLQAVRTAPADIVALVREVSSNPAEAARQYGRSTGTCSCCGRELTDPASVEAGIGPVCASKWGI